ETPVSAYLKVATGAQSFLLESVEGGERPARYSFIGAEPYKMICTGPGQPQGDVDPLKLIREEMEKISLVTIPDLPRFHGGAVGYLAYEAMHHFEDVPSPRVDTLKLPEAAFMFADTLLIFDHLKHSIKVLSHAHLAEKDTETAYGEAVERIDALVERLQRPLDPARTSSGGPPLTSYETTSNLTREQHEANVQKAKDYIYAGDVIQVVLSQRFSRKTDAHPFNIYRTLRTINPSPYMFYLDMGDYQIVGASPEVLVRSEDGNLDYHPIAGTRPRGETEEEDLALERELRSDEKDRAEHTMLLDLGRNDIGRVSRPGTVKVTQLFDIERYSHVMHLVSHVKGELRPEITPYDALWACFPAGTVSGAPKLRAMEIIAELEPDQRGPYAGAVGYFSFSGNMDTCITIRTMVFSNGVAHVQAGGGIVADSVPQKEYMETVHKAQALMRAIDEAEARAW
ncbi:MAG: anthranilate synthase component I, partial [Chloroflexi bacterium]|nr:anthranilate synthase component I [Chloroflexota bacterium]